jgi:hypothetical protein
VLPNLPGPLSRWIMHPQEIVPGNAMPDLGIGRRARPATSLSISTNWTEAAPGPAAVGCGGSGRNDLASLRTSPRTRSGASLARNVRLYVEQPTTVEH